MTKEYAPRIPGEDDDIFSVQGKIDITINAGLEAFSAGASTEEAGSTMLDVSENYGVTEEVLDQLRHAQQQHGVDSIVTPYKFPEQ